MTAQQTDELRHSILEFLALRHPNAYQAESIKRMLVNRQLLDFTPTDSEVVSALTLLTEKRLVNRILDSIDIVPAWQISAEGLLQYQRSRFQKESGQ